MSTKDESSNDVEQQSEIGSVELTNSQFEVELSTIARATEEGCEDKIVVKLSDGCFRSQLVLSKEEAQEFKKRYEEAVDAL